MKSKNRKEVHLKHGERGEGDIYRGGCTRCYHSCGTIVTVEDGKAVKIEGLKSHPVNKGKLCPKGEAAREHIYAPHRLKYPLKKVNGDWVRVTWDQSLDEIAGKLLQLKEEFGPSVLGVFSGSIGVENLERAGLPRGLKRPLVRQTSSP